MNNISTFIYSLLAQTEGGAEVAEEARQAVETTTVAAGMRWDGWMMLIIGILLLYGGLAWCLLVAAGRGNKAVWTEEEKDDDDEPILASE